VTVTSENLHLHEKVLDRETKWIKLNRDVLIPSKRADRDEILHKRGETKTLFKKRGERAVAMADDAR
jgi:hypothetical protein